jgi:hypothetical protein
MSGYQRGGLVSAFADEAAAQRSRPPYIQRQSRAGYGAFCLAWCWVTLNMCGPFALITPPPVFLFGWWGCAALGTYWLLAGLFGRARGPTNALGLIAEAAGASWLLWNEMYPSGMPVAAFILHGIYLSILCSALAQLVASWLALPSGDALALVDEDIAENEFDWDRM